MVPEWQRQDSQEKFYITNEFSAGFENSQLDGGRVRASYHLQTLRGTKKYGMLKINTFIVEAQGI